jgi:hypothetical protein
MDTAIALYDLAVPMDFNGYAPVARPAIRLTAAEVQVGDILLLDSFVTKVTAIEKKILMAPSWYALHIQGSYSIIRFPHETLSVIRPDVPQES